MAIEESTHIPDWLMSDVRTQGARLDEGQFARDLGEIGQALCEQDADRLKTILAKRGRPEAIVRDLEVVLPYYLPLLVESINRCGEESHLSRNELDFVLASHGKIALDVHPKIRLDSGRQGYALMQAAAVLADLDDTLAGPWYLWLKKLLQDAPKIST